MSGLTLIIGNKNYSSWSLRPWIFMQRFGIEFVEKRVALFTESMEAELASYFSNSKVPVLLDNQLTIWDSLAIMEYLSEQYLDGRGWPVATEARAVARSVSAEMHSSFTALREALPMNCRRFFSGFELSDAVRADVERICRLWCYCRTEYGQAGEWLFGEYGIADAMFAPVVLRFKGYGVEVGEIEERYMQTVLQQPAIQAWMHAGRAETEVIVADEIDV